MVCTSLPLKAARVEVQRNGEIDRLRRVPLEVEEPDDAVEAHAAKRQLVERAAHGSLA
jgi:hypothetical protein